MSLSSFLLPGSHKSKNKAIDKGLDDIFRSTASAHQPLPSTARISSTDTPAATSDKKRKATEVPNVKTKRSKSEAASASTSSQPPKRAVSPPIPSQDEASAEGSDEEEEEDGSNAEDTRSDDGDASDSDEEGDPTQMVHESLLKGDASTTTSRHGKTKHVPTEETAEQRDARTVFVGNVAVEVTKSRPAQKQLKRHLLSFVPSAKIESVRFRSVAFKKPTTELPKDDEDDPKSKSKAKSKPREHDRSRAASWRADGKGGDDEAAAAPPKQFLTPKEKKRIAFIKHEIHEQVDAVNAYVVFAHPPSAAALAKRPANVPPPAPVMDPYEAAALCAEKGDGSSFMNRTLRVDVVKKGARPDGNAGGSGGGERAMAGDPKATVFVGNLDFASKEEDLRTFFETLMREEKGEPGPKSKREDGSEESDEEDEEEDEESDEEGANSRTWVSRVRIVRDRDTQLGKGFAYVQFVERECVDEILALEQTKLKFAKRKLRVQRCKTLPGGPKLRASKPMRPSSTPSNAKSGPSRPAPAPRLVPATRQTPKGNPELGAKLAHLPKDERKRAKAADPDRVARRMAKKRAKTLSEKGVKSQPDRERVRKRTSDRKGGQGGKDGTKPKKRVRSGNAISKLNTKK